MTHIREVLFIPMPSSSLARHLYGRLRMRATALMCGVLSALFALVASVACLVWAEVNLVTASVYVYDYAVGVAMLIASAAFAWCGAYLVYRTWRRFFAPIGIEVTRHPTIRAEFIDLDPR